MGLNWNRTENTRRSGLDYSEAFDRAERRIVPFGGRQAGGGQETLVRG